MGLQWRKASASASNGACVEVAEDAGTTAVRNSKHPDRGMLSFGNGAVQAFVNACRAGVFDDLGAN
jgi:hypothetical protein